MRDETTFTFTFFVEEKKLKKKNCTWLKETDRGVEVLLFYLVLLCLSQSLIVFTTCTHKKHHVPFKIMYACASLNKFGTEMGNRGNDFSLNVS